MIPIIHKIIIIIANIYWAQTTNSKNHFMDIIHVTLIHQLHFTNEETEAQQG